MHQLTEENQRLLDLDRLARAAHRCGELAGLETWTQDEQEEAERLETTLGTHGVAWRTSTL